MTEDWAKELGERVRDGLGSVGPRSPAGSQAAFIARLERPRNRGRAVWLSLVAGAALAGSAAAIAFIVPADPVAVESPVSCVDGAGRAIESGATIVSTLQSSAKLRFSDESEIELTGDAQMTVEALNENEVVTELIRGHLLARVTPSGHRAWRIRAGSTTVTVVGTQFTITYDPDAKNQPATVSVSEGRVRVDGPNVPDGRVVLRAGDSYPSQIPLDPPPIEAVAVPTPKTPESPPAPREASPHRKESWVRAAARGEFKRAHVLASEIGLDRLAKELSGSELLLLADVERFAGPVENAQALLEQAARTPKTEASIRERATFRLGRLHLDQRREPRAAAIVFAEYLEGFPEGRFAEEATGLSIVALNMQGDADAARRVAQRYLVRFPDGAYVRKARAVIQDGSP